MSQVTNASLLSVRESAAPSFQSLMAIGAMLATAAVVAFACLLSDDSPVRARFVLAGLEVVLLTWVAGFVASLVHAVIAARPSASEGIRLLRDKVTARH